VPTGAGNAVVRWAVALVVSTRSPFLLKNDRDAPLEHPKQHAGTLLVEGDPASRPEPSRIERGVAELDFYFVGPAGLERATNGL
jgi:hypothetical protein